MLHRVYKISTAQNTSFPSALKPDRLLDYWHS